MTYPPKNRTSQTLDLHRIEIRHAAGVLIADPNTLYMKAAAGELNHLAPIPGKASDVSGDRAVVYAVDDLEVALTPAELDRLIHRDLREREFFALRDKYGDAHDWHDDFYHPDYGYAFQPKRHAESEEENDA
jgi:hypothetical protein